MSDWPWSLSLHMICGRSPASISCEMSQVRDTCFCFAKSLGGSGQCGWEGTYMLSHIILRFCCLPNQPFKATLCSNCTYYKLSNTLVHYLSSPTGMTQEMLCSPKLPMKAPLRNHTQSVRQPLPKQNLICPLATTTKTQACEPLKMVKTWSLSSTIFAQHIGNGPQGLNRSWMVATPSGPSPQPSQTFLPACIQSPTSIIHPHTPRSGLHCFTRSL